MKLKKNYDVLTFMSWDEEDLDGSPIRTIALCDNTGYFDTAINAVRDGDMGEKDEFGVYSRIWYGDYIDNNYTAKDIRPATGEEVNLYLRYCPLESRGAYEYLDERIVNVVRGKYYTSVIVRYYTPWWKKLWAKVLAFFGKDATREIF